MAQNKLLTDLTGSLTGPGINPTSPADATTKFEIYAGQLLGVLTIIGVLYFIVQIIFAGYTYISSKGDEKEMETSRKRLTEGILGLVIIVVAVGLGTLLAKLAGIPNVLDINGMFTKMGL
jgi:hypothetical protein